MDEEGEGESDACHECGSPFPPIDTSNPWQQTKIAEQVLTDGEVRWYEYCVPCYIKSTNQRRKNR